MADRNVMEISTGKYKVLNAGRNKLHSICWGVAQAASIYTGTDKQKSSFAEEDLGCLGDTKLNMRQQCVLVVKKPNSILDFIRQIIVSRSRVQSCVQFWTPQNEI